VKFVECDGTHFGLQDHFASTPQEWIPFYRKMYENCTTVTSNLEIVHLPESDEDLSFFENVRDVHGYVLIASNRVSRLPLTSLRVIRGRGLFKWWVQSSLPPHNYSFFVANNAMNPAVGLRDLELPNLMGKLHLDWLCTGSFRLLLCNIVYSICSK